MLYYYHTPHGPNRPSGPTHERYLMWKVGSELIASPCVLLTAAVRPPLRIMTPTRALVSAVSAFSGLIRSDGPSPVVVDRGGTAACEPGEEKASAVPRPVQVQQSSAHTLARTHTRRPGVRVNEGSGRASQSANMQSWV